MISEQCDWFLDSSTLDEINRELQGLQCAIIHTPPESGKRMALQHRIDEIDKLVLATRTTPKAGCLPQQNVYALGRMLQWRLMVAFQMWQENAAEKFFAARVAWGAWECWAQRSLGRAWNMWQAHAAQCIQKVGCGQVARVAEDKALAGRVQYEETIMPLKTVGAIESESVIWNFWKPWMAGLMMNI